MTTRFPLPVLPSDPPRRSSRGLGGTDAGAGENELPPAALRPPTGFERREVLQMAGASLALLGLSACWKTPDEKLIAYGNRPPELVPGNALHYATSWTLDGEAMGLLVTAREGRPIKIEGNPDHPSSLGSTGVLDQAALLQLYDANRTQRFAFEGLPSDFDSALQGMVALAKTHEADGGARLRFLLQPGASPLLTSLREQITRKFPKARIDAYSALSRDFAEEGAELAFGRRVSLVPKLKEARVVVSLDADFLAALPGTVRACRDFTDGREPGPEMNRLYVAESTLSVTGGFADHRLRLRPSHLPQIALGLAHAVAEAKGDAALRTALTRAPEGLSDFEKKWVQAAGRDLARHPRQALVLMGRSQPSWVHALAHAINGALDAFGHTVDAFAPSIDDARTGPPVLQRLVQELEQGEVDTLVITADNPVFKAPVDVRLDRALARAKHRIYWSHYEDETAALCNSILPAAHFLEAWGDTRAADGTVAITQPLIQPLFAGVSEADLLAPFAGMAGPSTHDLLKAQWQKRAGVSGDFQPVWEGWLAKGVVSDTTGKPVQITARPEEIARAVGSAPRPTPGPYELHFAVDPKVYDGRFAMNAWLQELPDPVTKNAWDNAALVSPALAHALNVEHGDWVTLRCEGGSVQALTYVLPGQADEVVTLTLGYGGQGSRHDGSEISGTNAYLLRRAANPGWDGSLQVARTGHSGLLANTQHHGTMEDRELALEKTLDDFKAHPAALESMRAIPDHLYEQAPEQPGRYRWAMTVDLNRCTGCSACVVACQAENNIPCVGKQALSNGREMHWMRLDRYFTGDLNNPGMITQPMLCQHCEAAPCEYVCPVNATVHSDEGLNEMVYNRCVGTRYCSNNCPYKVRRFNFLGYHSHMTDLKEMVQNPDVTVRARGVMEKCSYCVQRIERTRISTQIEGREIRDGEVVTACQQVCPTRAITFGTLTDPESRVSKLRLDARRYDVLGELGTRPRTGYLLRIKNPNPELAS